jgi:hypothetical protein
MKINTGGVALILLGAFFLATNFGLLDWSQLWKFWPLILVAVGVSMLWPKKTDS